VHTLKGSINGREMIHLIQHILTPYIRPREIDRCTGDFLYALYLLLRKAPAKMTKDAKQRTFEAAAVGEYHWEVVAISEDAVKTLHDGGGQSAVRRGHPYGRDDRFLHLFGLESPEVTRDDLLDFFFEHDATALVTKSENGKQGTAHWSQLYPVDEGLFTAAGYSVKIRIRTEKVWVARLQERIVSER
jgi:hypothetical protein